jgi:DNA-binding transcriptional LysR family regulator
MIDDLRALAIFAETIRKKSFRGAARVLNLSPSVVSYHVTQLEKRVGTPLLYRTTRKISLTHEGEILYAHASDMLAAAQTDGEKKRSKIRNQLHRPYPRGQRRGADPLLPVRIGGGDTAGFSCR